MVEFTETVEKRNRQPLNRFVDLSALDAVDLNFEFVFHVALGRRLSAAPKPAVKSAFYVTGPDTTHYAKLHAMLTDHSPLHVALFTDRAAAAKWLGVPLEAVRIKPGMKSSTEDLDFPAAKQLQCNLLSREGD